MKLHKKILLTITLFCSSYSLFSMKNSELDKKCQNMNYTAIQNCSYKKELYKIKVFALLQKKGSNIPQKITNEQEKMATLYLYFKQKKMLECKEKIQNDKKQEAKDAAIIELYMYLSNEFDDGVMQYILAKYYLNKKNYMDALIYAKKAIRYNFEKKDELEKIIKRCKKNIEPKQ